MRNQRPASIAHHIANMMAEDFTDMGISASQPVDTLNQMSCTTPDMSYTEDNTDNDEFTADELKIAKRFIELIGDVDRARDIIDRVDECQDCLGLIDDEYSDDETIEMISDMVPDSLDLPTNKAIEITSLYNPGAMR